MRLTASHCILFLCIAHFLSDALSLSPALSSLCGNPEREKGVKVAVVRPGLAPKAPSDAQSVFEGGLHLNPQSVSTKRLCGLVMDSRKQGGANAHVQYWSNMQRRWKDVDAIVLADGDQWTLHIAASDLAPEYTPDDHRKLRVRVLSTAPAAKGAQLKQEPKLYAYESTGQVDRPSPAERYLRGAKISPQFDWALLADQLGVKIEPPPKGFGVAYSISDPLGIAQRPPAQSDLIYD